MSDQSGRNKWNQDIFEAVLLPEATIGHCKNHVKCRQFNIDLANGYCTLCWDKGMNTKKAKAEARALKKANIPASYTGTVKKSRRYSMKVGGNTYQVG